MLITEPQKIGTKLFAIRKRKGLTQAEVAELSELSSRAYADIERGSVNMRIETTLKICKALNITPDEILTIENKLTMENQHNLFERLKKCSEKDRQTALKLLTIYLESIEL